jgi:hypothetical protein
MPGRSLRCRFNKSGTGTEPVFEKLGGGAICAAALFLFLPAAGIRVAPKIKKRNSCQFADFMFSFSADEH